MSKMSIELAEDRLDRLVNLDVGNRGIEPLYHASRDLAGGPLVGAAAKALLAVPEGGTVILTTGSVSRAWVSPSIGENDGPSGAAAIARSMSIARRARIVCAVEETLAGPISAVMRAAGLSVVTAEEADIASRDGSLATIVMEPYPVSDESGNQAAGMWLERYSPDLLFSTERVGRNRNWHLLQYARTRLRDGPGARGLSFRCGAGSGHSGCRGWRWRQRNRHGVRSQMR